MKKFKQTFLAAAFLFFLCTHVIAQNFQKYYTYGGNPITIKGIKACSDGGFIAAANDMLIKLNSAGDVVWARSLTISCPDCSGMFSVHAAGEVTGSGYYAFGVDEGLNTKVLFLMKTDLNGNLTWIKYFQTSSSEMIYDNSEILLLPGGDFLLTGSLYASIELIKANANGDKIWSKSYQGDPIKCPGFESAALANGDIITCYKDNTDLGIIATSSAGVFLWSERFINNGSLYDRPYSITASTDGNILIAGLQQSSMSSWYGDGMIMKMDNHGTILWKKIYSCPSLTLSGAWFYDIKQLTGSDILLTGYGFASTGSNHIVLKADNNGNIIYSKILGNTTVSSLDFSFLESDIIDNNNMVIAGDYFIFKNDMSGNFTCNMFDYPLEAAVNDSFLTNNVSSTSITELTAATQITGTVTLTAVTVVSGAYCDIVGIKETNSTENNLSVFPNPAKDELSFSGYQLPAEGELQIYNALGEKVFSHWLNANNPHPAINISSLAPGIYVVKILSGEKIFTTRVVKM